VRRKNVNANVKRIKKKSRESFHLSKTSQVPLKLTNLNITIAELSAIASKISSIDSKVVSELRSAATTSFAKIISYLNKLKQIGTGIPNTTEGIPSEGDISNIVASGLIDNQLFVDSLCQLLRIRNPPKIIIQEETNE